MPTSTPPVDWHIHANAVLKSLITRHNDQYGLGTMSASIYDTAWVSLVSRQVGDSRQWVFPHSFQHIYDTQASHGGWEGDGSAVDAIINTLACLLSLTRHRDTWTGGANDIPARIDKAVEFLHGKLQIWDILTTERIAFEIIVPSLLEMLEKESVQFDFPQRGTLLRLNQKKLVKLDLNVLYKSHTTVLHSLEAFTGKVDFDRLAHHKRSGSLMASPSSTAAYLMSVSKWDDEAEQYLHHVIEQCKSYGYGAVCNVWPTTVFEFSWTVCNLFESGFDAAKLDRTSLESIADILHKALIAEKGIIGFAPNVGPDADDSAKAITALHFLGVHVPLDALIKTFELPTHFQCFQFERNPSLSANCNVLLALLRASDPQVYSGQVEKAAAFIANEWWSTEGVLTDKWHLSQWYPIMLAAQGLLQLLDLHGKGLFAMISEHLLTVKIPITLFQMLVRVLQSQRPDGSWGPNGSREETAYAILALANLASLPYVELIRDQIEVAVAHGREYLIAGWTADGFHIVPADYIWVGKIGYGVEHVCASYIVSAMHISVPLYEPGTVSSGAPPVPVKSVEKFTKFYFQLPMFKGYATWRMKAWLIEGYLYLPELARVRLDVFDRDGMKEDPYFEYLPFSWTGPNGMEETYASAQTIFDMIVISMVNFQMDEFFDIIVQKHGPGALASVRKILDIIFQELDHGKLPKALPAKTNGATNGATNGTTNGATNGTTNGAHKNGATTHNVEGTSYEQIHARLAHFVNFIFTYPRIEHASENDKGQLRREMKIYLLAHTAQCEDNVRLQAQDSVDLFLTPRSSYLKWVRSTAADHLSSQYAFAFITCLLGHSANKANGQGEDYFPTSEIKYIAQDCSTHLSVICRIYNDYGSLRRDREEKNLNAVFFPEFEGKAKGKTDVELRQELARICDYERKCLKVSLDELLRVAQQKVGEVGGKRLHEVVRLFYNASEIYTEIYELRDISTWN